LLTRSILKRQKKNKLLYKYSDIPVALEYPLLAVPPISIVSDIEPALAAFIGAEAPSDSDSDVVE